MTAHCWTTRALSPIAGNSYLLTPAYLVSVSRQTYGYGVAYHLTGDPKYLGYMKTGVDYIRRNAVSYRPGMFTMLDQSTTPRVRGANSATRRSRIWSSGPRDVLLPDAG
jgi:hypothetical protein